MSKIAIDTNILLYGIDTFDAVKHNKAIEVIAESPYVSSQLISEFANVCLRKWKFLKEKVGVLVAMFLENCEFIPVTRLILTRTTTIMKKYKFQFFDSIIVSAALDEGCAILYSEDMQKGLIIEKSLQIVNPFI